MIPPKAKDNSKGQVEQQGCYALKKYQSQNISRKKNQGRGGMSTLRLGLRRIHVGSVAQISWECVTLLKGLPVWLNKGDLQRRGRENGESIQKTRPVWRYSRNMTCCQIFSGSNSLGSSRFRNSGNQKQNLFQSKKLIESFICICYYDSPKETVRGKWGRWQGLGLKERFSVTPWVLAPGPIRTEFCTSRPAKLMEKGRRCSLDIWQCHIGGTAVSGTRKRPLGPSYVGLGFLNVVIQCLSRSWD